MGDQSDYMFRQMDSYDTPENLPVSRLFRLTGRSRWYFYLQNFFTFCRSGAAACRGELDARRQIALSNENFHLVERCGGRIHLRGLEHLRAVAGRPVVMVGNHMSLLECALFHAIAREYVDFSFIIKESLLKGPYFRHIMKSLDTVTVTRNNPREDLKKVLTDGRRVLEEGRSMIVFPQSTRSESFDPAHFNTIGVKLAKSAGVPVLPFALKTDFIGNGRRFRDLGPVRPEREVWFEFAPALEISGNGLEQHQQIVSFISGRIDDWRRAEALSDAQPAEG